MQIEIGQKVVARTYDMVDVRGDIHTFTAMATVVEISEPKDHPFGLFVDVTFRADDDMQDVYGIKRGETYTKWMNI